MGTRSRNGSVDAALATLAARQHGLLRREDLLAAGLGAQAIRHRARTHRLHRHHPGVFSLGSGPFTRQTAWLAAQWWAAGGGAVDAVLSHLSAGAFHDHGPEPDPAVVHLSTTRPLASRAGVVVHRTQQLGRFDWAQHGLLRVTNHSRTLVDEAALLPFTAFRSRADRLRVLPVDALEATLARSPERPGCGAARRLLHGEGRHTKSVLERRFLRFCRAWRIRLPEVNAWVAGHKADAVHRAARLAVELDGRAFHERRAQERADRERDADYQLAGFRILRLTWWDLEPEAAPRTAARLRAFLGAAER